MSTHLILPGYQNSEAEHWQSYWERSDPARFWRVEHADWDKPQLPDWVGTLDRAVADADAPVVLVAHSLGCITVAHWAASARPELAAKVLGALLVAPADIDTAEVPELVNFRPVPLAPLPFRTTVVASDDDPWCTADRARAFADAWGATFAAVGHGGHLNTASALGDWPQGRALVAELTA